MPDSTIDAQRSVLADNAALARHYSELAATLATIGISAKAGSAANHDQPGELIQTASRVLRGLIRQLNGTKVQRNMLATTTKDWFWQWDMVSGVIRIETPPSLRGPKKSHETRSWAAVIHPDDTDTISAINGFSASGHDLLCLRTRMRADTGEWWDIDWKGRITERSKAGVGTFASGTLNLPREQALSAREATEREAKRTKLDFLANISHEIRTPMTAILSAAWLATEINDPQQQKELARTIRTSTESLVKLLDDALDFTKLEAGMVALESVDFDPRALIAETARIYELDAHRKGLEFTCSIAPQLPPRLLSDPVRIRQIVANLLNNAVKFTHRGKIELVVNAHPVPGDAAAWAMEISIRDTGIGIAPDKQAAIFEMFTQADASTTRKFGGTGIGLSISRSLASLLGGGIRVESQPGQGSVFSLDVTARAAPLEEREFLVDPDLAIPREQNRAPRRVLLAEDNQTIRETITTMLRRAGYQVDAVDNGAEAVEAYQLEPFAFDIILMDIQMPVMDGFDAAEGIRACEERRSWVSTGKWRGTPILAMTADALKNIETRCRDAGMNGVLLKPSSPQALFATIERTIAEAENTPEQDELDSAGAHHEGLDPPDELTRKLRAVNELGTRVDKALLDLNVPLEWAGKDPTALKQIIVSFRDEIPGFTEEIDQRLSDARLPETSRLLHQMKSSLKILGAGETCRHTEALYQACNARDREQARLHWASLRQSLGHLGEVLDAVRAIL